VRALLLALALGASAAGAERAPWPDETPPAAQQAERPRSVPGWLMWVYQHHISQVDAARTCRFEPTCGAYAREAIRRHGPLLGWLMACDRAIRYHGDTKTYRRALQDGHTRLLDPVSDNDFWCLPRRKQP
jgi:putative component of membrane protein insertase Oxa1/YidC/SpoIIIJ protein YidD